MKFGVCLPAYGRPAGKQALVEGAELAESLGYASIWSTDHILVPKTEAQPYGHLFEALISLAYVAPLTRRVRLGTSVVVLPLRDPALVAKQVATLDALSEGRLILGLGAGWLEDEFRFLNADFEHRGQRFDEAIRLMRTIWTQRTVNFTGKFYHVADAVSEPRPRQSRGPPLWIGGDSPPAIRRAAQLGDAWHPVGASPESLREGAQRIRNQTQRRVLLTMRSLITPALAPRPYRGTLGRIRQSIGGDGRHMSQQLERYAAVGLEYLVGYFGDVPFDTYKARMQKFGRSILPSFAQRGR